MFNLSCFPVLVKVYNVFPWLMYGQVRQPCLELQRNVLAGSFGFLSSFASFARTSRSRRFGERRTKAKKGAFKCSVDCRMSCFLRVVCHGR